MPFTLITDDHKYMGLEVIDDNLFAKGDGIKVVNVQVSGKGHTQHGEKFNNRKDVKVITLICKTLM